MQGMLSGVSADGERATVASVRGQALQYLFLNNIMVF
jgi:hypothetical protein